MNENLEVFYKLDNQFKVYLNHIKSIYDINVDSDEWHHKLTNLVDTRPIYPDESFQAHWDEKVRSIKLYIQNVSHERASEICKVYGDGLDIYKYATSPETIGTTLNHVREFYGDLERVFKYD